MKLYDQFNRIKFQNKYNPLMRTLPKSVMDALRSNVINDQCQLNHNTDAFCTQKNENVQIKLFAIVIGY